MPHIAHRTLDPAVRVRMGLPRVNVGQSLATFVACQCSLADPVHISREQTYMSLAFSLRILNGCRTVPFPGVGKVVGNLQKHSQPIHIQNSCRTRK